MTELVEVMTCINSKVYFCNVGKYVLRGFKYGSYSSDLGAAQEESAFWPVNDLMKTTEKSEIKKLNTNGTGFIKAFYQFKLLKIVWECGFNLPGQTLSKAQSLNSNSS